MIRFGKVTGKFGPKVWRVFIAGSSGAGKTFFAHNLLKEKLIDFKQVFYYHPDIGTDSFFLQQIHKDKCESVKAKTIPLTGVT